MRSMFRVLGIYNFGFSTTNHQDWDTTKRWTREIRSKSLMVKISEQKTIFIFHEKCDDSLVDKLTSLIKRLWNSNLLFALFLYMYTQWSFSSLAKIWQKLFEYKIFLHCHDGQMQKMTCCTQQCLVTAFWSF